MGMTDMSGTDSRHVRNVSATDALRALLDERGVGWMPIAWNPQKETFFKTNGIGFCADEYGEEVKLYTDSTITPAQAIEATLGRGTCHNLAGQDECGEWGFCCSECGARPKYDSGEVHFPSSGELPDGTVWLGDSWVPWRYCPNCGRRVVEE